MKKTQRFTAVLTLMATLVSPSLFADKRHEKTTNYARLVTVEGRIRDIDRERNGFVIRLDRGQHVLFAPAQTKARRLEEGDRIRATGRVDSRGRMLVDSITLVRQEEDRRDRNDRYLTGIVQSVERRGGVVWVEERRTGRVIGVDTRRVDRNDRIYDVDDVRRGDRITVRGDWTRAGRFEAERVDVDRGAQW